VTDASTIGIVEVAPDFTTHDCAQHCTHHNRDRSARFIPDLRPDGAADHCAEHRADFLAIAVPFEHAKIALPGPARVAHILRVVLLAPPMRLGVVRRICQNSGCSEHQRCQHASQQGSAYWVAGHACSSL
jgi:hypothetical protein